MTLFVLLFPAYGYLETPETLSEVPACAKVPYEFRVLLVRFLEDEEPPGKSASLIGELRTPLSPSLISEAAPHQINCRSTGNYYILNSANHF